MQIKLAKSTAEKAFDELTTAVANVVETIDGFSLARLERDARNGLQADPLSAYQALGLIGRYRWDNKAVDENFRAAMRISGSPVIQANYTSTLMSLDRFAEAAEMSDHASAAEPENLSYLRTAVECNWYAGRYERSVELVKTLKARSPSEKVEYLAHREQILGVLRKCEVPLVTVERLHDAVYKFLADKHILSRGSLSYVDTSIGEESVFITITVDREEDEIVELDEELTPVLFDAVEHFPLGTFSIGLGKFEEMHDS